MNEVWKSVIYIELIQESEHLTFNYFPELLDKFEVQTIWSRAFMTSTIPYCIFYFLLIKTMYQKVVLILWNCLKSYPIKPRPLLLTLLKFLPKKLMDLFFFFFGLQRYNIYINQRIVPEVLQEKKEITSPGSWVQKYITQMPYKKPPKSLTQQTTS